MSAPTRIEAAYRARTVRSADLARTATDCFPSGVVHDSRHILPYGIYVERAEGACKFDVDGNRYVDYFGGHGALILGHNHPAVMQAISNSLAKGTHFAANHPAEIAWAQQIRALIPSAAKVRFVASGTEATQMCVRLARAATGRNKVLRFAYHYHGWQDDMVSGYSAHFDGSPARGVPAEVAANTVLIRTRDVKELREAIAAHPDIAAAIVEPLGASTGMVPMSTDYLEALRELTSRHGIVLIFDEVITGFRVSPGGVQAATGITPDLTALAKIVAGGLPGGAVAGRGELLDLLDFDAAARSGTEKITHFGTFNGNPTSAAAGLQALQIVAGTDACKRAADTAGSLRAGMNALFAEAGVPWAAYGQSSAIHVFMNPSRKPCDPEAFDPSSVAAEELRARPAEILRLLRLAMLVNGVDISGWPGGLVSAAHDQALIEETLAAWRESLKMLKAENAI
jgi:glutamate-1-semialdehyde 2,1-aminomutase